MRFFAKERIFQTLSGKKLKQSSFATVSGQGRYFCFEGVFLYICKALYKTRLNQLYHLYYVRLHSHKIHDSTLHI